MCMRFALMHLGRRRINPPHMCEGTAATEIGARMMHLHDRGDDVHAIGTPLNVSAGTDQAGTDPRPVVHPDEP